jgi:Flp pilus assembly protein CpaB
MENIMSSKLFTTRQGTVLLGVIAAVIAAIALLVYLNHYRNSVVKPPVKVLVARQVIQQGTSGDVIRNSNSGYYVVSNIPEKQVDTGAIVNPATLAGQAAIVDIGRGQQLTAADFGPATGVSNLLGDNQRAVVVPLGSPQEVGGQIGTGSHVDVWVVLTNVQGANGVSKPTVKLLYQDMYVLGISGGNVTFRATPTQAGTLIYASTNASIWLTLRPTLGTTPKAPSISASALVGH